MIGSSVQPQANTMPTQVRIFTAPKALGETLAVTPLPRSVPEEVEENLAALQTPKPKFVRPSIPMAVYREEPLKGGMTFAGQDSLPQLPIPELEKTCQRYLRALKPLQSAREHGETKHAVQEFLKGDGPELQRKLKDYAQGRTSYIEQFCECHCVDPGLTRSETNRQRVRLVSQF
jgi:carnitine O-acetyltransferase